MVSAELLSLFLPLFDQGHPVMQGGGAMAVAEFFCQGTMKIGLGAGSIFQSYWKRSGNARKGPCQLSCSKVAFDEKNLTWIRIMITTQLVICPFKDCE